uniref:Uncharacterized protein n=1 Tax=Setaria digitata TaxID=48799 RepID=A0A915PR95_9BILA
MLRQVLLLLLCSLMCRWITEASELPVDREDSTTVPSRFYLEIFHSENQENGAHRRPAPPPIGRSSLKQKLDHFSSNDGRNWRQVAWLIVISFLMNDTFVSLQLTILRINQEHSPLQFYTHRKSPQQRPDGAVFLVVGGEDGADRAWLSNQGLPYVQLADQINASIFMLEHRFYGNSRPTNDTSVRNLKYLNAKQAVEDIDRFVQEMNQRERLTNPKWITFGGSYSGQICSCRSSHISKQEKANVSASAETSPPAFLVKLIGNLAAWAREKHSRTIRAAVASSAPLQAKLNFKGKKMREMSTTLPGRRELVRIFKLDDSLIRPTVSQKDIANFFLVISNYISFIVMHSGINVKGHRDLLTLDTMCTKLTHSPSLQSIRVLIGMVMTSQGKSPQSAIDVGYDSFLEFMRDERWNARNAQPRAWLYQNCHEFGHFRTSEELNGLFGGTLPLSFFLARCTDVFGGHFSPENTEKRIAETNEYFGGNQHFQATDVILSNGSDDPWTLLGVYSGTSAIGNYIVCIEETLMSEIAGTSHVADFYPPSNSDSNALRAAQYRIIKMIQKIVL